MSGCSALRLSYNNGATLMWWWIDGYVDFDREQTPLVKREIDRFLEWHRSTQLAGYVAFLATLQRQVLEPTTAAAACRVNDQLRERLQPAFDRVLVHAAEVAPTLGEAQFKHLEAKYAKNNDEMKADFMQADPAERQKKSVERTVERAEQVYGTLDDAQRKVIAAGVAASPFDPQLWLAERQRRQRDTLTTLRRIAADKPGLEARVAMLRKLADATERSPDPAYRAYQTELVDYNCAFGAQLHNATTPAQRRKARDNLKGWEEDLRSLVASGAPANGNGNNNATP